MCDRREICCGNGFVRYRVSLKVTEEVFVYFDVQNNRGIYRGNAFFVGENLFSRDWQGTIL